MTWIKKDHYLKGTELSEIEELQGFVPTAQWTKWDLSIVYPVNWWKYELLADDVYRFDTLKEAKDYWDNL